MLQRLIKNYVFHALLFSFISNNIFAEDCRSFFGPSKFPRYTEAPNEYSLTVNVPGWIVSPYTLTIYNGDGPKETRVSSGTVTLNGDRVLHQSELNKNIENITKVVELQPVTILDVKVASEPGSFLIIDLCGTNADHTPPEVQILEPLHQSVINTAQPDLAVHYEDLIGTGEPAASGINLSTLRIYLDGIDRTDLFTIGQDEATAIVPENLSLEEGKHLLYATIQDSAGNTGEGKSEFTVDLTPPLIEVTEPVQDAYLDSNTPLIQIQYSDNNELNLNSLIITVNGIDRTALFSIGPASASWTPSSETALPEGANTVTASIKDIAGNEGNTASSFIVDITPPVIKANAIPAPNENGWNNTDVTVQFTCTDALSGIAVCPDDITVTAEGRNQVISGTAIDNAGNEAVASIVLSIDKTPPVLTITSPENGITTYENSIVISGSAHDALSGIYSLTINGDPVTLSQGSFEKTITLVEGDNQIEVVAIDSADNQVSSIVNVTYVPNRPPKIISEPVTDCREGIPYVYDVEAIDPDKDIVSFTLIIRPDGMTIDNLSGLINWASPVVHKRFTVNGPVVYVNPPPVSVYYNHTDFESNTEIRFFTENTDLVLPEDVQVDIEGPTVVSGTAVDCYMIHFDSKGGTQVRISGSITFDRDVIGVIIHDNTLSLSDDILGNSNTVYPTGMKNRGLELNQAGYIDSVQLQDDKRTIWVSFIVTSPGDQIRVLVNSSKTGLETVEVMAEDEYGLFDTQSFTLRIVPNNAPQFTSMPVTIGREDGLYRYTATAEDPDGDALTFSLLSGPNNMTIDAQSGVCMFTPGYSDVGTHTVSLQVSDGRGGSATQEYNLVIENVNHSPEITSEPITCTPRDQLYIYDVEATDPDNDPISFSLLEFPTGMTIDQTTGVINWNPIDAVPAGVNINDGLVAYYPFNGNANDESGNGNHGIVNGVILCEDRCLNNDRAYLFDGLNDYIQLENVNPTGELAISTWVKPLNLIDQHRIVDNHHAPSGEHLCLFIRDGSARFWIDDGDNEILAASDFDFLQMDEWYHLVGVYNGGNILDLFVNGEKIDSDTNINFQSYDNPDLNMTIGCKAIDKAFCFQGSIDDIRIYNRALSEAEIQYLYGQFPVIVKVEDPQGAYDEQSFVISVKEPESNVNRPPEIISDPITQVFLHKGQNDPEQADLGSWEVIVFEDWDQGKPDWVVSGDNLSVEQMNNSNPSIFLSDFNLENGLITGTWRANASGDDDFMGFVFGYQDQNHFYLFDWKQKDQMWVNQSFSEAGMSVKIIEADTGIISGEDLCRTSGVTGKIETVYHNKIPYIHNYDYEFKLEFRYDSLTIIISHKDTIVATIELPHNTYQNGKFGFYNFSQARIHYRGFKHESLVEGNYVYDVEAVDPDNDTLIYSLLEAPPRMIIDSQTGFIRWQPITTETGSYGISVMAKDNKGGCDTQQFKLTTIENNCPVIISNPVVHAEPGIEYIYNVMASDIENDPIEYLLYSSPEGMTIVKDAGTIKWTPPFIDFSAIDLSAGLMAYYPFNGNCNDESGNGNHCIVENAALSEGKNGVRESAYSFNGVNSYLDMGDAEDLRITGDLAISVWIKQSKLDDTWSGIVTKYGNNKYQSYAIGIYTNNKFGFQMTKDCSKDLWFYSSSIIRRDGWHHVGVNYIAKTGMIEFFLDGQIVDTVMGAPNNICMSSSHFQIGRFANTAYPHHFKGLIDEVRVYNRRLNAQEIQQLGQNYNIQVHAVDTKGGYDKQTFSISVEKTQNYAPTIISSPLTSAVQGYHYSYDVDATDLNGDILSYNLIASPAGMTIDPATGLITWPDDGNREFPASVEAMVSDGLGGADTQLWTIEEQSVTPPVVALKMSTNMPKIGDAVTFQLVILTDVQISDAIVTIEGQTLPTTQFIRNDTVYATCDPYTVNTEGFFDVVGTVTDIYGQTSSVKREIMVGQPGDTEYPTVELTNVDCQEVTDLFTIIGTATDNSVMRYYLLRREEGTSAWVPFAGEIGTVTDGVLGVFDPTVLRNGSYDIKLLAYDASGNVQAVTSCLVVTGGLKVGQVNFATVDMSLPAMGLPVQMVREYDSRQISQGDFGPGWNMANRNVSATTTDTLGKNWGQQLQGGTFDQYILIENTNHMVVIRFSDNEVYKFRMDVNPKSQYFDPLEYLTVDYKPIAPTQGSLVALDFGRDVFLQEPYLTDYDGISTYDPKRWRLTTRDGTVYVIGPAGIESVTDPYGHAVTYSDNAITHSSGVSISIERDTEQRVQRITNSFGDEFEYHYNEEGYLEKVVQIGTTAGQSISRVLNSYGFAEVQGSVLDPDTVILHNYLEEIVGPSAIKKLENITAPDGTQLGQFEYDSYGRCTGLIDPDGNKVIYGYDVPNHTQTVTDRLGNITIYNYDNRGNVTSKEDPLNNVTQWEYDDNDNLRFETLPNGALTEKQYNSAGDVTMEIGPIGDTTEYTYDAAGRVLTKTDPLVRVFTTERDANGNPIKECGPAGDTVWSEYNSDGNLITQKGMQNVISGFAYDNNGQVTLTASWKELPIADTISQSRTEYDNSGRPVKSVQYVNVGEDDEDSIVTESVYDVWGNLLQEITPAGTSEFRYDGNNRKIASANHLGQWTHYVYDFQGRLTKTIMPDDNDDNDGDPADASFSSADLEDNPFTETTYDAEGRTLTSTDMFDNITRYHYDANGNRDTTYHPDGRRSAQAFDNVVNVVSSTDKLNNTTLYEYDLMGREIRRENPLGQWTETDYDKVGNRIETRTEFGPRITYTYDVADRLLTTTRETIDIQNPSLPTIFATTSRTYDEHGNVTSETDEMGRVTLMRYNDLNQLVEVEQNGAITSYAYDDQGRKTAQIDAKNHATQWTYDKFGRQISRILPLGQTETFTYLPDGRKETHTDFNSLTRRFEYDSRGRLIAIYWLDGINDSDPDVTYEYDQYGRTTTTTKQGITLNYEYDNVTKQVSRISNPDIGYIEYQYDPLGRIFSRLVSSGSQGGGYGHSMHYEYDALSRLTAVSGEGVDHVGATARYTYSEGEYPGWHPNVSVKEKVVTDGIDSTTTVSVSDNLGRLLCITKLNTVGDTISELHYTYDLSGMVTSITEYDGRKVSYTYDTLARLVLEELEEPGQPLQLWEYDYDPVGNRTLKVLPNGAGIDYEYNENDQLINDGTNSYTYDNNGSLTGVTGPGKTESYTYDPDGRLVTAEINNAAGLMQAHYSYDALGNRVKSSVTKNSITENRMYHVDPTFQFAQVVTEVLDNGPAEFPEVTAHLISDDRFAQIHTDLKALGAISVYHKDKLGSIRMLTDMAGNTLNEYTYTGYGEPLQANETVENAFKFTGEQEIPELGWYYLRARNYNPSIGRFTSVDPFAGDMTQPLTLNKYGYTEGRPTTFVDPSGKFSLVELQVVTVILGLLSIEVGGNAYKLRSNSPNKPGTKFFGLSTWWGLDGGWAGIYGGVLVTSIKEYEGRSKNSKSLNSQTFNVYMYGLGTPGLSFDWYFHDVDEYGNKSLTFQPDETEFRFETIFQHYASDFSGIGQIMWLGVNVGFGSVSYTRYILPVEGKVVWQYGEALGLNTPAPGAFICGALWRKKD